MGSRFAAIVAPLVVLACWSLLAMTTTATATADATATATAPAAQTMAATTTRSGEWRVASPESQGMSAAALDAMKDGLAARQTKALLVVRHDQIVYEWYAPDHAATAKHYTASMAKAIVGGLSLAVAINDRRIALDDPAAKFIPQWKGDARRSRITIRHLGSHTSGITDAEEDDIPHNKLTGWKGDFWKRLDPPRDPFTLSRDEAALLFEPGERMQYSNPGIALLAYAVTAAMKDAPPHDIRTLLQERVMRPIGVADRDWSVGYERTYTVDGLPLVATWGGGGYTARATAKVGRLMLHGGRWEGRQLITADAVRLVTADAGTPGHGAMGWWSNADGIDPHLPRDAYWGSGAGHQTLLVIPSLGLVIVRNGGVIAETGGDPAAFHEPVSRYLSRPLMEALTDRTKPAKPAERTAPYPPSPLIRGIDWAPRDTIVRRADGSDNWPLTWAADDALYGAYGDGRGFEPFVPLKLSLGLARIDGGPESFRGININAPTLERKGDGAAGPKASGLLAVHGTLYLWIRNVANSQLAWSTDAGATWTWADWRFDESFGAPTFLNFGPNYAGARDGYVYVYSHDANSAYDAADRMVLARVPVDGIKRREAYEFFRRVDENGAPLWTRNVRERGAVFTHARRSYRSGVTYNAPLKRYLWCQVLPESRDPRGPRFQGGLGLYDAPEPWGPWTTVFFTNAWDVGPGETCSVPTKWMSADGRTVHLVFSGDDAFSVRRATLR